MKRILLLVSILGACFLVGCSQEQPTSSTPNQKAAPDTTDRSKSK